MINKVILIGNVGQEPKVTTLNDGKKIANLSLATSEYWRDKMTQEKKSRTEWHSIVVYNVGLSKLVENYIKKGDRLFIEGQLQTRKYTDKNGIEKYSTEIAIQQYKGDIKILSQKEKKEDEYSPF